MQVSSKMGWLVLVALSIPGLAFAGRAERDMQREVTPKVGETRAAVRNACGCDTNIDVRWSSYPNVVKMNTVSYTLADIKEVAEGFCTSDEEKQIFCRNVRSWEVKFGEECTATLASGKMTLTSNECHPDPHIIRPVLDAL